MFLTGFSGIDVEFVESEDVGVAKQGYFDSGDEFEGTSLLLEQVLEV